MRYGKIIDNYLDEFCSRHTSQELLGYLDNISDLNVLVLGEAVIDEYIYGEVVGKTNKAASLVFSPRSMETFAGVPMNIANHLSSFCKSVDLKMMIGNDNKKWFFASHLNPKINTKFYIWDSPNIVKRRYIASYNNSKVFEVYDFQNIPFDDTQLVIDLTSELGKYDLVIVGDSGHGMMTYDVRETLKDGAPFLALNTQMNAGNVGTHSARKYMDRKHDIYICVNDREFRLAVHEYWDKYHDVDELLKVTASGTVALTMGPAGCKISRGNTCIVTVPAFIHDVVDTVGAGDAFLALTSPLISIKIPLEVVGLIGNVAGGLHSLCQGNKEYIVKKDLCKHINTLMER